MRGTPPNKQKPRNEFQKSHIYPRINLGEQFSIYGMMYVSNVGIQNLEATYCYVGINTTVGFSVVVRTTQPHHF